MVTHSATLSPADIPSDENPHGETALILGGTQGAGYDVARLLAGNGLKLVLTDPDGDAAQMAARSLGQAGMACDTALNRDMAKLAYHVADLLGDIDTLVLTLPPALPPGGSAAMSEADFTAHLRGQSLPLLQIARHFVPAMKARRHGAVVILAQVPSRPDPWQDAACAWLAAATRALAAEWTGVALNTVIAPRPDQPTLPKFMHAAAPKPAETADDRSARTDLAQAALAFCRPASKITGQVLHLPRLTTD